MLKKNIAKYLEANAQAKKRTENFCSEIDHSQSQGEIRVKYEEEILRLNRELILCTNQGANLIKIKKD